MPVMVELRASDAEPAQRAEGPTRSHSRPDTIFTYVKRTHITFVFLCLGLYEGTSKDFTHQEYICQQVRLEKLRTVNREKTPTYRAKGIGEKEHRSVSFWTDREIRDSDRRLFGSKKNGGPDAGSIMVERRTTRGRAIVHASNPPRIAPAQTFRVAAPPQLPNGDQPKRVRRRP
jgi:hypothetical protein